jgi:hypothetical protein
MPIQNRLLLRAYALAEKKCMDVPILLNAVIQENPNNIEAWEFYLNIFSRDRHKLEELEGRIRGSDLICPKVKEEVLVYYNYLLNRFTTRENALKVRRRNLSRIGIGICIVFAFLTPFWLPREIMEIILRFVGILLFAVVVYFAVNWVLKYWDNRNSDGLPSPQTTIRSYALHTQLSFFDPEMTLAISDEESAPEKKPTKKINEGYLPQGKPRTLSSDTSGGVLDPKRNRKSFITQGNPSQFCKERTPQKTQKSNRKNALSKKPKTAITN